MCGIVGVIGTHPAAPVILDALRRLEYRGYDSAGLATIADGVIHRCRAEGKLLNLEAALQTTPTPGTIGIGHTRWATHGEPTEGNAHPHISHGVAVVHNGIIENFLALKAELEGKGHTFVSQTDSEVIAHLLAEYLRQGLSTRDAFAATLPRLQGAFALGVVFEADAEAIYAARRGSPLVIGYGEGAMYLGSDALALAPLTRKISYLLEDDWAVITRTQAQVFDVAGRPVTREVIDSGLSGAMIGKGRHRHYMAKEIYEQPTVLGDTLRVFLDPRQDNSLRLPPLPLALTAIQAVDIVACGTSFQAGLTGRYWLEAWAGLPVRVDIASEYRYRPYTAPVNTLTVFISQSGETADTLAALRYCRQNGGKTVAIVNVPSASMAREADLVLPTLAGPEIGVASTKAFTTQLLVLAIMAAVIGEARGALSAARARDIRNGLLHIGEWCGRLLAKDQDIAAIARHFIHARSMLYIGRGGSWPIANEGALKLKELSYIHAEGFAAGELKHGPLALVDETLPIVVLAPDDPWYEKTISNLQEVSARRGQILLIAPQKACTAMQPFIRHCIVMPDMPADLAPILYAIPVQFLAYHLAVLKGTDVDQPRNLAKSVTVE